MEKARKSQQTKWLVVLLITAMIVALCTPAEQSEAAKKPRLSKKTVVLTVGKSKKVKVKYVNKKTKCDTERTTICTAECEAECEAERTTICTAEREAERTTICTAECGTKCEAICTAE